MEQSTLFVPVSIFEGELGAFTFPFWNCARTDKTAAWDAIIAGNRRLEREVPDDSKWLFHLPLRRASAISALRARGIRLLTATITLDQPVEVG